MSAHDDIILKHNVTEFLVREGDESGETVGEAGGLEEDEPKSKAIDVGCMTTNQGAESCGKCQSKEHDDEECPYDDALDPCECDDARHARGLPALERAVRELLSEVGSTTHSTGGKATVRAWLHAGFFPALTRLQNLIQARENGEQPPPSRAPSGSQGGQTSGCEKGPG